MTRYWLGREKRVSQTQRMNQRRFSVTREAGTAGTLSLRGDGTLGLDEVKGSWKSRALPTAGWIWVGWQRRSKPRLEGDQISPSPHGGEDSSAGR